MKRFHLGDILSVTTGIYVSVSPGLAGVHELLDYMTGDTLFTHQLPRAAEECGPALLIQHPRLKDIRVPTFSQRAGYALWLRGQIAVFGEWLPVQPLPAGDHTHIDPVAELKMKAPHMDVVVVEVPEEGGS